jgi:hypothetical protein
MRRAEVQGLREFSETVERCGKAKAPERMIVTKKDKDPPFQEPNPKRWATREEQVSVVSVR